MFELKYLDQKSCYSLSFFSLSRWWKSGEDFFIFVIIEEHEKVKRGVGGGRNKYRKKRENKNHLYLGA